MSRNGEIPEPSRYRSLHSSRRALARASPLVRFGIMSVGLGLFLDQVRPLITDSQFTWGERRVIGAVAVTTLGGCALAAWVVGSLIRAAADLIEVLADGAEASIRSAYLVETQLVPALTRAAVAMEGVFGPKGAGRPPEVDELRSKLEAAIAAEDADDVIACRDALTLHLSGDALKALDHRVVRWLAGNVRKHVHDGTVTPEVIALAVRTADSFGDTTEGVALLTALPKLRRRAGLCPRCESPYRGPDAVCPDCLAESAPPGSGRTNKKALP